MQTAPLPGSSPAVRDPLAVVFCADDRMAVGLGVAVYSLLVNLDPARALTLYVVDGGLGEANRRRLDALVRRARNGVSLVWVRPDLDQVRDLRVLRPAMTHTTYLRLQIPALLPEHLEKALYLDCDVVVEGDLGTLWDHPFGGHALLAVQDVTVATISSPQGITSYRELGLDPAAPYFNAGVMLVNLRRWRAEGLSAVAMAYVRRYRDQLHFHEQEGLNVALSGRWGPLDPRWNYMISFPPGTDVAHPWARGASPERPLSLPYLIHFSTPAKPWKEYCFHPARPRFVRYLRASKWFGPAELVRWHAGWYTRRLWWLGAAKTRRWRHRLRLRRPKGRRALTP